MCRTEGLGLAALGEFAAAIAEACGVACLCAFDLGDDSLDGPSWGSLDDDEVQHHDAKQRGHNKKQTAEKISRHVTLRPRQRDVAC